MMAVSFLCGYASYAMLYVLANHPALERLLALLDILECGPINQEISRQIIQKYV